MTEQYWCGEAPTVCQVCDREIVGVFVDGKTQWDCWAFMCKDCWEMHGEGLGVGLGQMYGRQIDGRWQKLNLTSVEPRRETRSWQEVEAQAALSAFGGTRAVEAEATLRHDFRYFRNRR